MRCRTHLLGADIHVRDVVVLAENWQRRDNVDGRDVASDDAHAASSRSRPVRHGATFECCDQHAAAKVAGRHRHFKRLMGLIMNMTRLGSIIFVIGSHSGQTGWITPVVPFRADVCSMGRGGGEEREGRHTLLSSFALP